MSGETFQLSHTAAESYEGQKVPAMFRPLAKKTLGRVRVDKVDSVLDVACGTGIVARMIGETVPEVQRLVGCDLNEGMISVARSLSATASYQCEWNVCDVASLPFDDDTFSLCFCQQGLQFFPEKELALREIRRVLAPEGRLALTVWSAVSPLFSALAESLAKHVSDEVAMQSLAPFSFRDGPAIEKLLRDAGFVGIQSEGISVSRALGPAAESIPGEIAGNPVGAEVTRLPASTQSAIVNDVAASIEQFRDGGGYGIPQETHLFVAKCP